MVWGKGSERMRGGAQRLWWGRSVNSVLSIVGWRCLWDLQAGNRSGGSQERPGLVVLGAFWEDGSESCGYDQLVWGWTGLRAGGVHPAVKHMEHIVPRRTGVAGVEAEGGRFTKAGQRGVCQRCQGAEKLWEAGRPVGQALPRPRDRSVRGTWDENSQLRGVGTFQIHSRHRFRGATTCGKWREEGSSPHPRFWLL